MTFVLGGLNKFLEQDTSRKSTSLYYNCGNSILLAYGS